MVRVLVMVGVACNGAHVPHDGDQTEREDHHPRRNQEREQRGFDVVQVAAIPGDLQQGAPQQYQQDVLGLPPHLTPPSTSTPAGTAQPIATTNVTGAKRLANPLPNAPVCSATSLTSTAGPTTRNTSRGSNGSADSDAATNASASLHSASTTASSAITMIPSSIWPASEAIQDGGTRTLSAAAVSPPSTRNPPEETRSCRAVSVNTAKALRAGSRCGRRSARGAIHSGRPNRAHSHPITIAAAIEPRKRASTIRGSPGNATAVDTSTTGFTAGAASRKVSAAAGGTPCCMSRRDTGTEAHSHPGSAIPATPATGTAATVDRGNIRRNAAGGTKAAISPLTSTPSTKNGIACTHTATNTVAPVRTAAMSSIRISGPRTSSASTRTPQSTSIEVIRRHGGVREPGAVAARCAAGGAAISRPATRYAPVRPWTPPA